MVIVFGNKWQLNDIGSVDATCPFCSKPLVLGWGKNKPTLYWIPINIGKERYALHCDPCEKVWTIDSRTGDTLRAHIDGGRPARASFESGSGWVATDPTPTVASAPPPAPPAPQAGVVAVEPGVPSVQQPATIAGARQLDRTVQPACSKCGTALVTGARFCQECGTPTPQPRRMCPNCGFGPSAASFCSQCGTKLKEPAPSPTRQDGPAS